MKYKEYDERLRKLVNLIVVATIYDTKDEDKVQKAEEEYLKIMEELTLELKNK